MSDASLRWFIGVPRCSSCCLIQNTPCLKSLRHIKAKTKQILLLFVSKCQIFYIEGKNVSLFDDLFCEYSLLDNCVYKEKIICIITVFLRLIIK